MKKSLLIILLSLTLGLTACGGSKDTGESSNSEVTDNVKDADSEVEDTDTEKVENNEEASEVEGDNAAEDSEVVTDETEDEESDMDLSIYPSSNIEAFEANGIVRETYDQMYAKIEPLIVETGVQERSGTAYYKDADGNDLLLVFYDGEEVTSARFCEYYKNGQERSEVYTYGIGDALSGQRREMDVNGQLILQAYETSSRGKDFLTCYVYDYDEKGNLIKENCYEDDVLDTTTTYNENGDELLSIGYEDGQERYRFVSTYDEEGKLLKEEDYFGGTLENWQEYEYDSNGHIAKQEVFSPYVSEAAPYLYYTFETYENGSVKKSMQYQLDEGMFFDAGEVATEDMYVLVIEIEGYENGFIKSETVHGMEYLENGQVAYKRVTEYTEDSTSYTQTYYDKEGNVIPME